MTRALVVLAFAALSAVARTETPVAPLTFGPVRPFFMPAIATDGVQSFAVWADGRDRVTNAIYGARVAADGTLLDPIGVRLFDSIGSPSIAYGDGRYFVVDSATHYAIVDRDANVLARGTLVENAPGGTRVVFNGRDFVVFWGYDGVNVSIVDRDGRAGVPFTLVAPRFDHRLHAAVTNGSRIVVLYTRGVELRAAVASATGMPISDDAIAQNMFPEVPASVAAWNGGFVAVWQSLAGPDILAVRLDANGAFVRGPVLLAANATGPQIVGDRLYAAEGDALFLRLTVRAIASDLTAGPPSTVYQSQFLSIRAYAANETHAVAQLHDPNRSVAEEGLYVVGGGEPKLVSRAAVAQFEPRIAIAENGPMIAWHEEHSLWAAFGPETFLVAPGDIRNHAVASLGRTHLIAWATFDRFRVRLYREHVPLTGVLTLDTSVGSVAAASDGEGFVVAWSRLDEVRLVRFSTGGDVVASYSFSYENVTSHAGIALACDDGECLIVWRNQTSTQTCPRLLCRIIDERVLALRLDRSLTPVDAAPIVLSGNVHFTEVIVAAADDGEYAVSWVRFGETHVRTLGNDETLIVPGRHPALVREGDSWLLVRQVDDELVALRLRDMGAPYEFTLFADAQSRSAPALASDGTTTILAYERTTRGEASGGVPRIHVTAIEPAKTKRRAFSR